MALKSQSASILNENANGFGCFAGKSCSIAKCGGLNAQQLDLSDRKTVLNINKKPKPLPNSCIRAGAENNGFSVMSDPQILGKLGVKGRACAAPRTPLSNITNVKCLQNSKVNDMAIKDNEAQANNLEIGPNSIEEMKQKAEVWGPEGIEKVHFSGKDMEALHEKMAEEEVNRLVAQALSYKTEIPCWLPAALVKEPHKIKDQLELDPVEDLHTKGDSCHHGTDQQLTDVNYDESFLERLEILQTASKDWPAVIEECVW